LFAIRGGDIIALDLVIDKGGAKEAQPPLSSLAENNAKTTTYFFLSRFATAMLRIWGHIIHHWKGFSKTFATVYYKPPNSYDFSW
jgi:hypothetical protein